MQVQMVNPALIREVYNSRFGLLKSKLEGLTTAVKDAGEIRVPLEVFREGGDDGCQYTVHDGHYRRQVALNLNKEGAGLEVPIRVIEKPEPLAALLSQLSVNLDRGDLTIMDRAKAMKDALDLGASKLDVRNRFAAEGGRKGKAIQPLSNSYLNMYLSFLTFPKKLQNMLQEGFIGVADAYRISKAPDKWEEIVAELEAARAKQEAKEAAEEAKLLDAGRKVEKLKEDAQSATDEAATKKAEADKLQEEIKAKVAEVTEKHVATITDGGADADARKKAKDELKAGEADIAAKRKLMSAAQAAVKKLEEKAAADRKKAEEAEAASAAKKAAKKKEDEKGGGKAKLSGKEVKTAMDKAAAATDKKLNLSQLRELLNEMAKPGVFPIVREIAAVYVQGANGEITFTKMYSALGTLTGEKVAKAKK